MRYQFDRRGERVELKTMRSRRVIEMPGSLVAALHAPAPANCNGRSSIRMGRAPQLESSRASTMSVDESSRGICFVMTEPAQR